MKPPFTIAVLADYIAAERFERLPKRVVTKAVHCIQDSVACLLGAYSTRLAGILTGFARERGGPMEAHVLGSRIRTSCTTAAFANALLINALDYDDIDLGHMGATAISAAFASGEKTNAAGKDLIAATVVGYEVSARIGRALLPTSPRKKTHGWGTWQTFGTAAASTCLLKLEPDRAVHALAIAGANAPVPSVMKTVYGSCGPNMVKNNFGTAADCRDNGVLSCYRAETGERVYRKRLGSGGMVFSASPVAANGKIYLTSELGDVFGLDRSSSSSPRILWTRSRWQRQLSPRASCTSERGATSLPCPRNKRLPAPGLHVPSST